MAHPIDLHVGQKLRQRRCLLGLTQQRLAAAVGIKFQQIQKYENGTNRICASKLYKIARQLSVDVEYFFQDMPDEVYETSTGEVDGLNEPLAEPFDSDPLSSRDSLALLHDYQRIPDEILRNRVGQFMRALANSLTDQPHDLEDDV